MSDSATRPQFRNAYDLDPADIKIEPGTERWYEYGIDSYLADALEKVYEWDYRADAHGYCHDRSTLVALVREIARLRVLTGELP